MAHGFSATIRGMVADKYAETFQSAGFTVLLYDHRNFGASDGTPRQEINRWVQARGYRDAINFLVGRDEVDADRIAIWGDSASAAETIVVGAIDPRVRAIIAQVPACGDEPPPDDADGSQFAKLKTTLIHGNVRSVPGNTVGPLPVVSSDQLRAPFSAHASDSVPVVHRVWWPVRHSVAELGDCRPPSGLGAFPSGPLRATSQGSSVDDGCSRR
jgi:uncharacterized protein